jgi:alginate O-acetyltransferase complex protein AlgI
MHAARHGCREVGMHFVSSQFLVFFLVTYLGYWLTPSRRERLAWLLLASCVFYMSWNLLLILLILFTASVDFVAALLMERTATPRLRKALLVGSITINLGLLAFFKYANFLLGNVQGAFNVVGLDFTAPFFQVALPLGISFYTFETISYIVDVYRRRIPAARNPLDYALFIMFFPHLVAGPIVRPGDFLPQLRRRQRFSWPRLELGVRIFLLGFCKKAVLADQLGALAEPIFANPVGYSSAALWIGVVAYALQIYGDFSGYSDMAIGLAHMFGFKLKANFNMPYIAQSITEFWHRWHISLSTWLRDYLYIPLGGSRGGTLATCRNLMLTMLLGGFWHGASWTFVIWGAYHGVLLTIHRLLPKREGPTPLWRQPLNMATTFVLVCVGWVFFRAETLDVALTILHGMFVPVAGTMLAGASVAIFCAGVSAAVLGHVAGSLPLEQWQRRLPAPVAGALTALFCTATLLLIPESGRNFIYFQF